MRARQRARARKGPGAKKSQGRRPTLSGAYNPEKEGVLGEGDGTAFPL